MNGGDSEWDSSSDGHSASVPDEVRQHIADAMWHIVKDEASFFSTDPNEIAAMMANLERARIGHEHIGAQRLGGIHKLAVPVKELDEVIPEWRDLTDSTAISVANTMLKGDAEKRADEGRPWQEGIRSPDQSIMFCCDEREAKALIRLLKQAKIKTLRQGEGGLVLVVDTHALQRAGINVKTGGTELAVDSEEKQQSDARDWLKQVKWNTPSEGSPLARAVFNNRGAAEVGQEFLRDLGCYKDLKRLSRDTLMKDKHGFMLEVNADSLKKAVPGVIISPFTHNRDTGERVEDREAGR